MNTLLNWLSRRQNRLTVLFCVFTLSAWWILKNQIAFAYPLTKAASITDLTILSDLKEATLLTRWVAIVMDHGVKIPSLFAAIHTEDWVFLILGSLFCFKLEGRKVHIIARIVVLAELLVNGGLAYVFISALNSTDTLAVLNNVKLFAGLQLALSLLLMILLFITMLRLSFHEYSD
jgi:hypothetical protein